MDKQILISATQCPTPPITSSNSGYVHPYIFFLFKYQLWISLSEIGFEKTEFTSLFWLAETYNLV